MARAVETVQYETLTSVGELQTLAAEWDPLVLALPRPSPWLLHAWLVEWLRHYGGEGEAAIHVARRDGKLVGALPLFIERRFGVRVADFFGHFRAAPVDVLVAEGEDGVAAALADRAAASGVDLVDIFGLHESSRLVTALGPSRLRMLLRVESPVLDLSAGWDATYRAKTDSKKRNLHKRRRRQLGELGRLESTLARTPAEVDRALEGAFRLHERRWVGRPDGSGFVTPVGKRFHRAAALALAADDLVRIVTLSLDDEPIAFHYYFALAGRMFVHRLAFDPKLSRYSPGLVNTLDALEAAAAEGLTFVEYLGGGERYKLELSDRFDPLYEGFGLARTPQGKAFLHAKLAMLGVRRRLKRSQQLRRFYFEGLAPARRTAHGMWARVRRS